jgi:hypothetical protein
MAVKKRGQIGPRRSPKRHIGPKPTRTLVDASFSSVGALRVADRSLLRALVSAGWSADALPA